MTGRQAMKPRIIPLFVAAALSAGSAQAADETPAPSAKAPTAQQQAAREEIDRLVKRIEELSKQLGDDGDVRVIVRRGHGDHPEAFAYDDDQGEDEDADGERKVVIRRVGPGDAPMALPGDDGPRKIRMERFGPGDEPGFHP